MNLLDEIAREVAGAAEAAWFVGGCVRDLLRGVELEKDLDVALRGSTHAVGRILARRFHGHVFYLREEEEVVRVLLPDPGLQLDLTPVRGTIEEDLLARDLTINAMAIPVEEGLRPGAPVIDPAGGRADLAARLVRFVTPAAPESDPLRTLRALRFRWKLGFELAEGTAERIRACTPLLERVSGERIRDELFQLLPLPSVAEALQECFDFGMAPWLMGCAASRAPEGARAPAQRAEEHGCPALETVQAKARAGECAARVRALCALLETAPPDLDRLLAAEVTPPRRRRELLLWAAALQPLVPPLDPAQSARALALSHEERNLVVRGLAAAAEAREIARRWPQPGRVRLRLFQKAGPAGPEAVLLAAAAEGWSSAYAELLAEALHRHFWPEPPLLSGIEVMQILGVRPGPAVGRALQEVEEARADGLIRTPEEAAAWLRERYRRESTQEG